MRPKEQASTWKVCAVVLWALFLNSNIALASLQEVLYEAQGIPSSSKLSLEDLCSQYQLPCLAVRYNNDSTAREAVTGVRKYDCQPKAEQDDQFHLGSLTKAMTATLLAVVVKNGWLTWETTLAEALPTMYEVMQPSHRSTTLRMLTSHRSGISIDWPSSPSDLIFFESLYRQSAYEGRQLVVRRSLSRDPSRPPGSFVYNNNNFIIAGAIIESALNSTWEALLTTNLFSPLNMTDCGLGPNPESSSRSIDNPWPHTMVSMPSGRHRPVPLDYLPFDLRDNPPALNSAGRVHCPLESYSRFLQAHVDGGSGQHTPLGLEAEDWKVLHTPYASRLDNVTYSPGAWNVIRNNVKGGAQDDAEGYTLTHEGSNTLNYVIAAVTTGGGKGEAFVSATNVGGDLAQEALQRAIVEMKEGDLFSDTVVAMRS